MQLACKSISVSYDAPRKGQPAAWALDSITLEVHPGEFLGIAGPTGSGKSTLLSVLAGLTAPSRGTAMADSRNMADKAVRQSVRGRIGAAFQYPERQLFAGSVLDDVAFGPLNLGASRADAHASARDALRQVGLDPNAIESVSPFALSGGQQRRVALAGVLAMQPEILLLDEPAAGLDPLAHSELIDLVARINAAGTTVVMASHNMDDLAALCDRVLVLDSGTQALLGTPAEVFGQREVIESLGLDVPRAQKFALDLKAQGIALPRAFYPTIESLATDLATIY